MTNINKYLAKWLNDYDQMAFPQYEKFPEFDLYMEQMMNYIDKQFATLQTSSLDKQITKAMINNYVKGEVIPAPIAKKYSKEHLSTIDQVGILKRVLTLGEIKELLDNLYQKEYRGDVFNNFLETYQANKQEAVSYTQNKLEDIPTDDIKRLSNLSLDLATKAEAYLSASKRILFLLRLLQAEKK